MSSIMDIIADETNGISYKSYKYCFDGMDVPSVDYDDHKEITWKKYGETKPPTGYEDMKPFGFKGRLAIVLPAVANQKDWDKNNNFFNNLCKKINENSVDDPKEILNVLAFYRIKREDAEKAMKK